MAGAGVRVSMEGVVCVTESREMTWSETEWQERAFQKTGSPAALLSGIKVALGELELEQRENFCKGGRHENHLEVRRSSKNG